MSKSFFLDGDGDFHTWTNNRSIKTASYKNFDLTVNYKKDEIVLDQGSYYLCIQDNIGHITSNTTYWALIPQGAGASIDDSSLGSLTTTLSASKIANQLSQKANSTHSHSISDVTSLQSSLDGKASIAHTHAISDVTNLQSTLNGKASTIHSHTLADITDVDLTNKTNGYALQYDSISGKFVSKVLPTGSGSGATSMSGLSDVDVTTTTPINDNVLTYEAGKWIPKAVTTGASTSGETYIIELGRWSISNNSTNAIATTTGINSALSWAYTNNYGIVILPSGTYLIDKDSSVILQSNTHYKFYGCIFVKQSNGNTNYETVTLDTVQNVTVEGGSIKGDRESHDYVTVTSTHEWGYGVHVKNASYNVLVKNMDAYELTGDGYAVSCNFDSPGGMQHPLTWVASPAQTFTVNNIVNVNSLGYSYKCTVAPATPSTIQPTHTSGIVALADGYSWQYNGTLVASHFAKGDINASDGTIDATKTNYTTVSKFFSTISALATSTGYLFYAGDGYGGYGYNMNLNKVPIKVHFYGSTQNYLGSQTTRTYEFIYLDTIPTGTTQVRFSFLQNYDLMSGNLHYVMCAKIPQFITFKGCKSHKNRRQGSSVMGGKFITYEDCEFYDISNPMPNSTGCAPGFGMDVEDGYQLNHKITVRNSNFHNNRSGSFTCVSTRGIYLENNKFSGYVRLGGSGDDYFSLNNMYYGTITGQSITSGVEADGTFCTFSNDHIFGQSVVIAGGNSLLENCVLSKCTLSTSAESVKIYNCKMTIDDPSAITPIIFGNKYLEVRNTLFDIRRGGSQGVFSASTGSGDTLIWSNVKVLTGEATGGTFLSGKNIIVENCQFIHSGISTANYSSIVATESMKVESCTFKNLSFRFDGNGLLGAGADKTAVDVGYSTHIFKNNKIVWDTFSAIPANFEARGQGVGFIFIPRLEVINNNVSVVGQGSSLGSLYNLRAFAENYLNLSNNTINTTNASGISTTGQIYVDWAYRGNATVTPRPKTIMIAQNNRSIGNSSIVYSSNLTTQLEKNIMGNTPSYQVFASSLPTNGYFQLGEEIKNSNPQAGGNLGWVCVTSGYADTTTWTASTMYPAMSRILSGGKIYEAQNTGKSTASTPTFPASGNVDDKVGATTWTTATPYSLGQLVVPSVANGFYYECTTAGTSGATEPTWSTTVNTAMSSSADNTVVWTPRQIITWKQVGIPVVFKQYGTIQV